jgi:hypothetical protein
VTPRFVINRRRFLRGLGMTVPAVALPVLRQSPLLAAPPPLRLAFFYTANGVILDSFWPTGEGTAWTIPAGGILTPLLPWKAKLNVLYGVNNHSADAGPGSAHQKGVVAALNCGHALAGNMNGGNNSPSGYGDRISVDQYLASKRGEATRIAVLSAGVRMEGTGNRHAISYLGPNQPVFPEDDPAKLYARVFGNFVTPGASGDAPEPAAMRLLAERKSALDYVSADLDRLSARLPGDERVRLQRHLESLRDLERQISPSVVSGASCAPAAPPALDPKAAASFPMVSQLQLAIIFMAFACDQTRIAHLMWSGETSQQTFPWLGINDPHHSMSHAPDGDKATHDKLIKVDSWFAGEFASLLKKMDGVTEGNGKTMLDNGLMVWLNGLGKGNNHTRNNIPYVLAGSAGGYFTTGRFLKYNNAHNDLMVSILNGLGLPGEKTFGDPSVCKGPLPGLAA